MVGALPMACGLARHLLLPSEADSCTMESCGTFSHVGSHWAWFFVFLINAESTVCKGECVIEPLGNARGVRR